MRGFKTFRVLLGLYEGFKAFRILCNVFLFCFWGFRGLGLGLLGCRDGGSRDE